MKFRASSFVLVALFLCVCARADEWTPNEEAVPFISDPLAESRKVETEEIKTGPTRPLSDVPPYVRLLAAALRLERIERMGGWPKIPPGDKLRAGDFDPRVKILRQRLRITGQLISDGGPFPESYDADVDEAVGVFQMNHDMDPTGELDVATIAELNVPVETRLETIKMNIERWRELPPLPDGPFVLVDIAGYQVRVYDHGKTALAMRAVVGQQDKATPVFASKFTQVVLNPWWSMPRNIAVKEALPEIQSDPTAFFENKVEVVDVAHGNRVVNPKSINWKKITPRNFTYAFRQAPGEDNPLGKIKFVVPNPHDIYLHGTPEEWLFRSSIRAFSHGCVRLERPIDLALYVLNYGMKDPKWTKEKLQKLIDVEKPKALPVAHPLPVYFAYWTAWVNEEGDLQFRHDAYGRDAKQPAAE